MSKNKVSLQQISDSKKTRFDSCANFDGYVGGGTLGMDFDKLYTGTNSINYNIVLTRMLEV